MRPRELHYLERPSLLAHQKLLVCLDCGLTDVLLNADELRNLRETDSSVVSREILADVNVSLPPKSPLGDQ